MIEFPCGCRIDENFELTADKTPLDCPEVFANIYSTGNTIGVFQVDTPSAQRLSKRLKPKDITDISNLVALNRPGPIEGTLADGETILNHFIKRNSGEEVAEQEIEALRPILSETHQLLIFQESAMKIGHEIAGFSLADSDSKIRKGIAKKKAELLLSIEKDFIDGCKRVGKVSEKEAREIFDWIKKCQRYIFSKLHSVPYAINSYLTAWCKYHFPVNFYCHSLNYTKNRDEIKKFVYDAYKNNVEVYPPELERLNSDFVISGDKIFFGLGHVKGVGEACIEKLKDINNVTPLTEMTWLELLFKVMLQINKTYAKAFMASGALRNLTTLKREQMMYEYDHAAKLTKKEKENILQLDLKKFGGLVDLLKYACNNGAGKGKILSNKNRIGAVEGIISSLQSPSYDLSDNIGRLINYEQDVLGLPMSCYYYENIENQAYCVELSKKEIREHRTINVIARVDYIKEYSNDNGKIAYLGIFDNTAELRGVKCYTKVYEKLGHILMEGKDYIFTIAVKGGGDNLIINNVHLI